MRLEGVLTAPAVDGCCGYATHLRGVKLEVQSLPDPPHTTYRWLIVVHWQCHAVEGHHGEWSYTTDDPDEQPPFRAVDDPAKRQAVLSPQEQAVIARTALDPVPVPWPSVIKYP